MTTLTSRPLDHLKTNLKVNEFKTRKLLSQSRIARHSAHVQRNDNKHKKLVEKKVVNSLTHLIDSKNEKDYKNTLLFNVLVLKIKEHLIRSGKCRNDSACNETARKMAAFVSDIMKETRDTQKVNQRRNPSRTDSGRMDKRSTRSMMQTKERLSTIPEEQKTKRMAATSEPKTVQLSFRNKEPKQVVKDNYKEARCKTPTNRKEKSGLTTIPKNNKQQINSWLADVDDRTKKWSRWIKETVAKAEQSKQRVKSGEDIRDVSKEWKRFMKGKKQETASMGDTSSESTDWQREAYRKRGERSIQEWLMKSKLMNNKKGSSDYSAISSSNDSICSMWSSRAPSSIVGGESVIYKLKKMGFAPVKTAH